MKKYRLIPVLALLCSTLAAQTPTDALTFGQHELNGSARYMSMAGAFNALGGDFSTLSVNPAGLGVYRSSEFSFTTDLMVNKTTAEIGTALSSTATSMTDLKPNFNINNVGYVLNTSLNRSGLIALNFGFGFNRLKNYHKSYRAEALGSPHSLTDNWAVSIGNGNIDGATTGAFVADQAYLLNRNEFDASPFKSESPLLTGSTVDYIKDVVETGRVNEWLFSVGGNYEHTIYFGATIGIQGISYKKKYTQTEFFNNNADGMSYLRYESSPPHTPYAAQDGGRDAHFIYNSEEQTEGIGFQTKIGVLVRPMDMLRIGLAVHAPSVNYLTVDHYSELTNNTFYIDEAWNEGSTAYGFEDIDPYKYRTLSPYKVNASVGLILGKKVAIDAEVDMTDYSSMMIMGTDGRTTDYSATNDAIKEMYKMAYNARIGAEFKLMPTFALRGGVAFTGSPFENNILYKAAADPANDPIPYEAADYVGDRMDYSLGFGYRSGDFFMDFAYVMTQQKNKAFVFDDAIDPYEFDELDLSHSISLFKMTMGFKF